MGEIPDGAEATVGFQTAQQILFETLFALLAMQTTTNPVEALEEWAAQADRIAQKIRPGGLSDSQMVTIRETASSVVTSVFSGARLRAVEGRQK